MINGTSRPKWMHVEHSSLINKTMFLVFDGLCTNNYVKNLDNLSAFKSLTKNQFPVSVPAKISNGYIVPGMQSVLDFGVISKQLIRKKTFDEMILSEYDMIDNGYPVHIPKTFSLEKFIPKCSRYKLKLLTEDELKSFSELSCEKSEEKLSIIAIDCEMVLTQVGDVQKDELARLSATNSEGVEIINQIFKPSNPVVDYRTQWSGITPEILENATVPSNTAVEILSKYANKDTIIVGHSLENDLRALKLIHTKCIDTSVMYSFNLRPPNKPSLETLYRKYIQKPFRENPEKGHDSSEDARAAMELVKHALLPEDADENLENPPEFLAGRSEKDVSYSVKTAFIGNHQKFPFGKSTDQLELIYTKSDDETLQKISEATSSADFIIAHFGELLSDRQITKDDYLKYNQILKSIISNAPKRSVIIVYAPNGKLDQLNSSKAPPMHNIITKFEAEQNRQGLLWIHCTPTNE